MLQLSLMRSSKGYLNLFQLFELLAHQQVKYFNRAISVPQNFKQ
uniref:Uncharacterized protein n=1 Tax=Anguilla anguilla TaxID=7936 RepID=A0A0E9WEN6_ANGAN